MPPYKAVILKVYLGYAVATSIPTIETRRPNNPERNPFKREPLERDTMIVSPNTAIIAFS